MFDILTLLQCLLPEIKVTTMRQLSQIIMAMLAMSFQIEFNFRDAKQFWGLEDFMNRGQTAVTNAANQYFLWSTYLIIF